MPLLYRDQLSFPQIEEKGRGTRTNAAIQNRLPPSSSSSEKEDGGRGEGTMDFRGIVDQMFAGEGDAKKGAVVGGSAVVCAQQTFIALRIGKGSRARKAASPSSPLAVRGREGRKEVDISAEGKREGDGGERGRKKAL